MGAPKTLERVNSFAPASEADAPDEAISDLSDFAPKKSTKPRLSPDEINQISQETGFVSRQPQSASSAQPSAAVKEAKAVKRPYVSTFRKIVPAGRSKQLSFKVTDEVQANFQHIATKLDMPYALAFDWLVEQGLKAL